MLFGLTIFPSFFNIRRVNNLSKIIIRLAYDEDIGSGDITSLSTIRRNARGKAVIIAKSDGILSGSEAFEYAFALASKKITVKFHRRDGQSFKKGLRIATIEGPSRAMLKGERLAMNLLAHLSGVATLTSKFVARVKGTKVKILDTRKTTPGIRWLEKRAVVHGGGVNHRMGLYDMVLIKDNHIAAAGGVAEVLERVSELKCPIEIEVSNFAELKTALDYLPDIIMLDNFTRGQIKKAVRYAKTNAPKVKIEVSGGVNLKNIRPLAETGIDYISIGALTHSAPAADFSMKYDRP